MFSKIKKEAEGKVEEGELQCAACHAAFPILRFIPRFAPGKNYATSFGYEWKKYALTMYDSYTKTNISERRLFRDTKWPRRLEGEVILEGGCGAGRYTEPAAATGAMLISLDYSAAVEVAYERNGQKENVFVVQGDIYQMPFKPNFFNRIFCFGVLQHTPDVEKAFFSLLKFLKPRGRLAIDVYRYDWWRNIFVTRYWIRRWTKKMPHENLHQLVKSYIKFMWPLTKIIHKLPYGTLINRGLLVREYRDLLPLNEEQLLEWAILDTFDNLAAQYDQPQSLRTVQKWFEKAGLNDVEVFYGGNGVCARGMRS